MERNQHGIQGRTHTDVRWRGVRASVWMLWLGGLSVVTAGFVALLTLHSGGSSTGIPLSLQVQRKVVPLSVAPGTTTTLNGVVSKPMTSVVSPTAIIVKPRQPVSEGDRTASPNTNTGSSGATKSTTGSTVADH